MKFSTVWHLIWTIPLVYCAEKTTGNDVIRIGYITGSEKIPETGVTSFYRRPGQAISGAITLAVNEINNNSDILPNHKLEFVVAETYGKELYSIKQTVELMKNNISVFMGPQETCIH